jgi:hypothetical protein
MSKNGTRGLPSGWVETTLGEISQPLRPRRDPQDYPELPFIGMEHLEAHTMRLLDTVPARIMKSSAVHFWPGDVLYGRLRPYLNKVYCPEFEGLCSAEFIVFPGTLNLNMRYLQYLLNSKPFVSFASHRNEGDRPRVDFDQLAPHPVSLPPLPEQHRIVAEIEKQFTRLDTAVAALTRTQANLKRYRATVLRAACEGRLVETEAELARKERREYEPADRLLTRILNERRAKWEADQLAKMQAQGKTPKDNTWKEKYQEPSRPDTTDLPELPEGWLWASPEQLSLSEDYALAIGPFGSNLKVSDYTMLKQVVGEQTTSHIIMATHDPLVIAGLEKPQVQIMRRDENTRRISAEIPEQDPKGMGVAAILTSELFGLRSSLDLETLGKLDQKRELAAKEFLTPEEKVQLDKLNSELGNLDFTRSVRDPLYKPFVEAMVATEEYQQLKKPVLTPEEQQQQKELAIRIVEELRRKRAG